MSPGLDHFFDALGDLVFVVTLLGGTTATLWLGARICRALFPRC